MTVTRYGNVSGSRADLGWYSTRPGKDLLATNLEPADFLFDSTWPKLGNLISAGTRTYVPTGISTVVTWPTQSTIPLVIAYWRRSTTPAGRWLLAVAANGYDNGFVGTLGTTFYVDAGKLVFHESASNTTSISVRWRVYDRATVPSGTPGAPRERWILDGDGWYVTPPGITAKTAPATQHLFHPDLINSQCLLAGETIATAAGIDIPFNWSQYSGDYSLYALSLSVGEWLTPPHYDEVTPNIIRITNASNTNPVRWAILK